MNWQCWKQIRDKKVIAALVGGAIEFLAAMLALDLFSPDIDWLGPGALPWRDFGLFCRSPLWYSAC